MFSSKGMDIQKQEMREAVELPLTHFELYKQIGIDPPRGVLMYGPPGCGKTMLAKAVAHHTTASFIRVVGSEFVQKYLGEGPRMVRDVFRLAKENAPAIIFIDEIDAIATKRFDAQTGGNMNISHFKPIALFREVFWLSKINSSFDLVYGNSKNSRDREPYLDIILCKKYHNFMLDNTFLI